MSDEKIEPEEEQTPLETPNPRKRKPSKSVEILTDKKQVKKKRVSGPVQKIAQSEKIQNYAGAIAILLGALPAIGSLIVSVTTSLRGEPEANRAYEILAPQLNNQKTALQIALSRLSKIEGLNEGMHIGKIQLKLDQILEENKRLKEQLDGHSFFIGKSIKAPKIKLGAAKPLSGSGGGSSAGVDTGMKQASKPKPPPKNFDPL